MRKGTLTDAQTLRLYEKGTPVIALCLKEGMTVGGALSRIGRERARRRKRGVLIRQKLPQPTYTSVLDLVDAMNELSAAIERMTPVPRTTRARTREPVSVA